MRYRIDEQLAHCTIALNYAQSYILVMSQLRRNLSYLIARHGTNPTVLARATGVPQPTIHRILKGESDDPRTATLEPLASHFNITVEFLRSANIEGRDAGADDGARAVAEPVARYETGTGEETRFTQSEVRALHPESPPPEDSVQVKEYRVSFSAGRGRQAAYDIIEESEPATYRLSWFQKIGISPKNARRFKVTGDSMEPFLYAGDSVLIDLAENDPTHIIDGKVYAIRYGNDLRIKRLTRRIDGTLILRSDNPAYRDEEVPPELADEHIIIGRVREKSGAGGL